MSKPALAAAAAVLLGAAWWAWSRRSSIDGNGEPSSSGGFLELGSLFPAIGDISSSDQAVQAFDLGGAVTSLNVSAQSALESVVNSITPGPWTPPARAAQWLPYVYAAADKHGIPRLLFARQIHKESQYRPEIIDGRVKSSAGAVGIAQIVPKWHPDVNPLDPVASLDYAAAYMAQLYRQFGTWSLALAAYNWGPGNLAKYGFERRPPETRDYVAVITSDSGYA